MRGSALRASGYAVRPCAPRGLARGSAPLHPRWEGSSTMTVMNGGCAHYRAHAGL